MSDTDNVEEPVPDIRYDCQPSLEFCQPWGYCHVYFLMKTANSREEYNLMNVHIHVLHKTLYCVLVKFAIASISHIFSTGYKWARLASWTLASPLNFEWQESRRGVVRRGILESASPSCCSESICCVIKTARSRIPHLHCLVKFFVFLTRHLEALFCFGLDLCILKAVRQ